MIKDILLRQREYYGRQETRSHSSRIAALKSLKQLVRNNEVSLLDALHADLGKSALEAYAAELSLVLMELDHALRYLHRWMRPKRVRTPLILKPGSSFIRPEPLGSVLILGPWNYPVMLLLAPLVGALAAGNTVVLKPSEYAPRVAAVLAEIVGNYFKPDQVAVCTGDASVANELVQQPFDHIFFTGSTTIGRKVMQAAAANLTPVTLELGGKSPCIVWDDVELDVTCRRVIWGKFLNAGQTCIAPDYILVQRRIMERFVEQCIRTLQNFYGNSARNSKDYARIVNQNHFDRLIGLLEHGTILHGGDSDRENLFIGPTLIHQIQQSSPLLHDEIFGPILPIIPVYEFSEALTFIQKRPKPLTMYLFSRNETLHNTVLEQVSSGSVCFNDTISQIVGPYLPFGGVGHSGMGRYHGQAGFDCFSNHKSVLKRRLIFDLKQKYPPYTHDLKTIKRFMNWLG
ncbi:aldehyde dehydrogenase [bacterium]|nr:aldehyde dehydrogenase [bacterium]